MKLHAVNLAVALALLVPAAFAQSTEMCDRGVKGYFRCSCNVCLVDVRSPNYPAEKMCATACAAKTQAAKIASDIQKTDRRQRRIERVQGVLDTLQQIEEARRGSKTDDDDDE